MKRLRFSPRARLDLKGIHAFLSRDDRTAADRVIRRIRDRCAVLMQYPNVGEAVDELSPGLRRFSAESYVIYFHVAGGRIEVVRVLHGAQDADSQIRNQE